MSKKITPEKNAYTWTCDWCNRKTPSTIVISKCVHICPSCYSIDGVGLDEFALLNPESEIAKKLEGLLNKKKASPKTWTSKLELKE